MMIARRSLGSTGMALSRVGIGTYAIGGAGWSGSWGKQDDGQSVGAIRRAVELGVNWIDTAPVYGLGHAEEVVGQAVRELPVGGRPFIFTKCGLVWDKSNRRKPSARNLRPDSIRGECEASLRRLGVEQIALYQIHAPDTVTGTRIEDSWGAMTRLVERGLVQAIGVSNFDLPLLERCEAIRHVDTVQPALSLIVREAARDILPWCEAHGIGVIVHSPMRSGLLTDGFTADSVTRMPADDWRRSHPDFVDPSLSRNLQLCEALTPIAKRHGASIAAVAVAWTLAWPGVTAAIVGARSPAQVEGWIGAGGLELTPTDLLEISKAARSTGAGCGPDLPTPGHVGQPTSESVDNGIPENETRIGQR